jgi:short-subunit dehydrogenase
MSGFFENKVVCITGSGQGIGRTTAMLIGSLGAKICLNGRNEKKLIATELELKKVGVNCIYVAADLAIPSDCERLISSCVEHFGKLDILINNAGIASRGRISETGPEAWEQTMRVNFNSAVNCSYFALPHLLKSKGSVIMVSSMAAKVGVPGHASYSASKMALTAYSRALQNEYSNKDLHCGLVFVGFTDNEDEKQILQPNGEYATIPKRPGLKMASRDDVAKSIAKCLESRKNQMTLSLMGKMQHILLRIAPGIVYALLRKSYRDYDKTYS